MKTPGILAASPVRRGGYSSPGRVASGLFPSHSTPSGGLVSAARRTAKRLLSRTPVETQGARLILSRRRPERADFRGRTRRRLFSATGGDRAHTARYAEGAGLARPSPCVASSVLPPSSSSSPLLAAPLLAAPLLATARQPSPARHVILLVRQSIPACPHFPRFPRAFPAPRRASHGSRDTSAPLTQANRHTVCCDISWARRRRRVGRRSRTGPPTNPYRTGM